MGLEVSQAVPVHVVFVFPDAGVGVAPVSSVPDVGAGCAGAEDVVAERDGLVVDLAAQGKIAPPDEVTGLDEVGT